MSLRGHGVGNLAPQELHGVTHGPCACVVNLQMQMGSRRVARVAADGHKVACTDGELAVGETDIQRVGAPFALNLLFVGGGKALQVAVDAGVAVRVADIEGIAEAILVYGQSRHTAVGYGKDLLALHIAGLDVQSAMEVPRTRFTEVARQRDVVVDGTLIGKVRKR